MVALRAGGAICSGDDGFVDAVGGIVRGFDQQEQLWEGVILERDALGQPPFGDRQQLREEPRLVVTIIVAEVFLQGQLRQQEGNLVGAAALQVVQPMLLGRHRQ